MGTRESLLRVCLIGADSTGKTTLCDRLAKCYGTVWVPEYAREFLQVHDGKFSFEDMPTIAKGQLAAEEQHAQIAKMIMFCDGSPLASSVWCERYFGSIHPQLTALASATYYDLYLHCRTDVPYEVSPIRNSLEYRDWLDLRFQKELQLRGCRHISVEGNWDQRFQTAFRAVNNLLQNSGLTMPVATNPAGEPA